MPSRETTLEHLDVTYMLNIATVLTLEILYSAVHWIHAGEIWLVLGNTTKPRRKAFIHHYFTLLILPFRAFYLPSKGFFWALWVFISGFLS